MKLTNDNSTDIMLDEIGQPVRSQSGDFDTVSGDGCWEQDLLLESQTEEGELFYEDETGTDRYGYGLTDFLHAENSDFTRMEIAARIKKKIDKREFIDPRKTKQDITVSDGGIRNKITISKQNSTEEYNIELIQDKVEVLV